ncbi:MAG: TlpA disulfide reductase family protein [Ginsengibacter sp.]
MTCFMLVALVSVCWSQNPVELKNGFWRATIQRSDGQQIVFNFQSKDSAGKKIIYVINGKEHLLIDSMVTLGDSVFIQMPFFESGFSAKITADGNLQGVWIKKNGAVVLVLPFNAVYNHKERFAVSASPVTDITGSWSADFIGKNNKISALVGEFKQDGAYLSGTFRDPTGDYRFLQGVVDGDSLKLSAFDGSNAFLFTAKIDNKNKISGGRLYSGALRTEEWSAVRNDKATLPDVFSETKLRPGAGKLNFSFPEMSDGSKVSINDKRFKNKVVVISILGSWCPNCMDETKFLSDYYNKNHQKDIEFIGLAYERDTDFKTCQRLLQPFKKRFNVQYPILITGVALSDSLLTEKTLPQLEKIHAFPTTIFVDKKGNIRKIHSGFDGPATGKYYIQFKKEFNEIINQLLGEE